MTKGPDHEQWEDAAGTYVLDALEADERAGYEAHLEDCPACRAEVAELRVAVEALPVSPPPMLPSPALKARIMAEVEREAALLASAGQPTRTAKEPARAKRRWKFSLPMPAVAFACTALIVGVVAGGVLFGGSGEDSRTIPFKSSIPTASAELEMGEDGAIVVANGLPPTPAGKTYMVWIQRPGHAPEPTSALFTPRRDGSATASVNGDMEGVESVLVNTEPVGGSTTPTSDPVLTATLS
jgi:anti-sigma-K factor RskA